MSCPPRRGWDDDLAEACASAYGPDHPDGSWQADDTRQIRAMFDEADRSRRC